MNTVSDGFQFIHLDAVDSTNNYAAKWLSGESRQLPAVILADFQSAGKGQRGNIWESKAGDNLTCSLIVNARLPVADLYLLNMRIALSIALALEDMLDGAPVKIKWPNDILINRKKIAGILIENSLKGEEIDQSIIGFGVNVNQRVFDSPNATSVVEQQQTEVPLRRVLDAILRYWKESDSDPQLLQKAFFSRLMGYGSLEVYEASGARFRAKIIDVTRDGQLHMEDTSGKRRSFREKEIRWIRTG